jgi:hypothetical protein
MVAHEPNIQELRTQLQASRWQLHATIQQLENRLNVPRRIRSQMAEHPFKWVILAVGAGFIAAGVAPRILRVGSKGWMRNLVTPVLRIAIVTVLPKLMHFRASEVSPPKVG